ncbi:nuclear transport factor 2 family protein [Nocardia farcinica]|uniref:nuclear transport factor 2 family protein n=1 Tax=Nocardia farcinica TaxID=37329 RepID=UPI0018960924|nr:nuclear transport factor 2 family protein [Nocardia farcinica]MBF6271141.1 nuclear transport factor 2 family protein [Nocardia farcinica]MCZ9327531.1 nuclear transport factor 2 family protein [Nocardia farcinica]
MSDRSDHQAIIDVLNQYSYALDTRDWPKLEDVFHPDATGDYGGFQAEGRATLIQTISGYLDPCGPSQHLLGNYHVTIDGDEAVSSCYVRVVHVGQGERADLQPYESIGTYHDRLQRTSDGWRITHRRFDVRIELGDVGVLGAPKS